MPGELPERTAHGRLPHNDDTVNRRRPRPELSPGHADLPLQAVPFHGRPDGTRNDQAQPRLPESMSLPQRGPAFTLTHVHHQPSGSPATALAQHTTKFP